MNTNDVKELEEAAKAKWNAIADEFNQWDSLDSNEKQDIINSMTSKKETKEYEYHFPVTCIVCNKNILPLEFNDPDINKGYEMVDSGIVGKLYAPYGSKHDGDIYQIGICDDCVEKSKLKLIGNYMGY